MSHQEKQRIFDEYAYLEGYSHWKHLISSCLDSDRLEEHIFAACDLIQEEQQKRILDNVRLKLKDNGSICYCTNFIYKGLSVRINELSVINPENKIQ